MPMEWPRLVEPVREMLIRSGLPYVIENVDGAPLINAVVLCGTMFPGLRVLRHRLFEANFQIVAPPHKKHPKVQYFLIAVNLITGRLTNGSATSSR